MPRTPGSAPPWMVAARAFIGIKEIRGSEHTPEILEMFRLAGHSWVSDDETPWCAAAANAALALAGFEGTGQLNARSFLNFGEEISTPRIGDIVVFWRVKPDSWQGHVGFFAGFSRDGDIICLGGNQGDEFNFSQYQRERLLGYRRPVKRLPEPVVSDLFTALGLDMSIADYATDESKAPILSLLFDEHSIPRSQRRRIVDDWLASQS